MAFAPEPTKLHYLDGRPTELTLRRIKLEVLKGDRVETHTFDQRETISMGAADDNDLVLRDETVSRNHCRVFQEAGQYLIRDLDSTNGTFVNRVRVREAWLKPGCTITLGTTELRFASTDETFRIVPSERSRFQELIGRDVMMREIYAILEKIGPTDATVVIEGETGTGKEVVARSLHLASRRANGPFMVFDLQPKLLRVLEQREVKRVGGTKPIKVDVRVVAATNRDLEDEVRNGRFREDLFYRLSVVRLKLPSLRLRIDDIPILIQHFLKNGRFNQLPDGSRKVKLISRAALDRLLDYDWPGNVRELHNVIERAVSFAESDAIEVRDLPDHIAVVLRPIHEESTVREKGPSAASGGPGSAPDVQGTFKDAKEAWVATFEKDYIEALLKRNNNNISHAAREAEIDRKYFRKLMKKYGITAHDDGED